MQAVNNLKMNRQVVVFLVVLVFFFLLEDFKKLKGFEFPLLKIIVKLIRVILFLVVFLHKKEIFDENQRKIEYYFKKLKKHI